VVIRTLSCSTCSKFPRQAISCIGPEVCEAVGEEQEDYKQVRQICVVVCERSLELDFNLALSFNDNCIETLLLQNRPHCSKSAFILPSSTEEIVTGEMLAVRKLFR